MVSESADQLSKRSHRSKIFFNFGKLTFQKKNVKMQLLLSVFVLKKYKGEKCQTLFDPMDCSLPGSSVCEILQARILECVAMPFSR